MWDIQHGKEVCRDVNYKMVSGLNVQLDYTESSQHDEEVKSGSFIIVVGLLLYMCMEKIVTPSRPYKRIGSA